MLPSVMEAVTVTAAISIAIAVTMMACFRICGSLYVGGALTILTV